MANEPIIGSAKVRITADTTGLNQGIDQSEKSFDRLGKAASQAQSIISKLLIPTAVVGSVTAVVNQVTQAIERFKELREQVDELGTSAQRTTQDLAASLQERTTLEEQLIKIQREAADRQRQNDELRAQRTKEAATWAGVFTGEIFKQAEIDRDHLDTAKQITREAQEQARLARLRADADTDAAAAAEREKKAKEDAALLNDRLTQQQQLMTELALRQAETEEERIRIRAEAEVKALEQQIEKITAAGGPLTRNLTSILQALIGTVKADAEKAAQEVEDRRHKQRMDNIAKERDAEIAALNAVEDARRASVANNDLLYHVNRINSKMDLILSQPPPRPGGRA